MELTHRRATSGPCLDCFRTGLSVSVVDQAEAATRQ